MTTTIPTTDRPAGPLLVQQLIDAVTAHPEVREPLLRALLTEDFLTLPDRVSRLQSSFDDFRAETQDEFRRVNARIDANTDAIAVNTDAIDANTATIAEHTSAIAVNTGAIAVNTGAIAEHRQTLAEHSRIIAEHTSTIAEHTSTIAEHTSAIAANTGTIAEHTSTIAEHTSAIAANTDAITDIRQTLAELSQNVAENNRRIRRMDGHVGRLRGAAYEDRCREEVDTILDGLVGVAVLVDRARIKGQLLQARVAGLITRAEYLDGLRADIIARDQADDDHAGLLLVGECSITFNRDDLETAARRADIIGRVTGVSTQAFLVTHYGDWPADIAEIARQLNVAVLQHQDPDHIDE